MSATETGKLARADSLDKDKEEMAALYQAYGLILESEIKLSRLPIEEEPRDHDVRVTKETIAQLAWDGADEEGRYAEGSLQDMVVGWESVGEVHIRGGKEIRVCALPGVDDDVLGPLVLGVGMGVLLAQRGDFVLHASAVSLPTGSVAFVGFKGDGKSTLAAACMRQGYPHITDDVLALRWDGNRLIPRSGYGGLKLWPDAISATMGTEESQYERVHPDFEKRIMWAKESNQRENALEAVFVLEPGNQIAIEPITGHRSMIELMRHSYVPRFLYDVGTSSEHIAHVAKLARSVPVFSLQRPSGLELLPDTLEAVLDKMNNLRVNN